MNKHYFILVRYSLFIFLCPSLTFCDISTDNQEVTEKEPSATPAKASCMDEQENIYPLVKIGDQVWMAQNLKLTQANCADAIPMRFTNGIERGPGVKFYDGSARYAYYNNDPDLGFGVIYSYAAIQQCDLCPSGFRLPTKADFEVLLNNYEGKIEAAKALLKGGKSGFNAEMGGRIDSYGSGLAGSLGFWWTTDLENDLQNNSKVYNFELSSRGIVKIKPQDPRVGNYVRCIKQ